MPVFTGGRWVTPGQTYPTVSWSFATLNLDLSSQLSGYRAFEGPIANSFWDLVRQAFAAWEAVSFIDFVETVDGREVDIRLGDIYIDGSPRTGQSTTLAAATTWAVNGAYLASQIWYDIDTYKDRQTFYSVSVHEIGHAIGLGHAMSPDDVMYYSLNGSNISGKLSSDDISGIQLLYGSRTGGSSANAQTDPAASVPVANLAAASSSLFFLETLPTASEYAIRSGFAASQYNYYATVLKVSNPAVGTYEAFGAAYASLAAFSDRYGLAMSTTSFVNKAYQDVLHRAATEAQQAHFTEQIVYFRGLYTAVGMSSTEAELKARGAVTGQMLGFAMTDVIERQKSGQTLDDTAANYFANSWRDIVTIAGMAEHGDEGHSHSFGFI